MFSMPIPTITYFGYEKERYLAYTCVPMPVPCFIKKENTKRKKDCLYTILEPQAYA